MFKDAIITIDDMPFPEISEMFYGEGLVSDKLVEIFIKWKKIHEMNKSELEKITRERFKAYYDEFIEFVDIRWTGLIFRYAEIIVNYRKISMTNSIYESTVKPYHIIHMFPMSLTSFN